MATHKYKTSGRFTNTDEYLVHIFVEMLLLVLDAPDELLDMLEEAIHLNNKQRAYVQERLARVLS